MVSIEIFLPVHQKFFSNSTSKKGILSGFDCKIAFAATHRTKQFLKTIVYKITCKFDILPDDLSVPVLSLLK